MHRYFVYLSYDGSSYCGWQVQPNGVSVQETLMDALTTLLREEVKIIGAGRTDSGVHAKCMIAHFDLDREINSEQLVYKLNKILPPDIAVSKVVEVNQEAHARFDATSRTYEYYVSTFKNPFNRDRAFQIHYDIDIDLMNEACKLLFNYIDFTSFSKLHTDAKTNNCTIYKAEWVQVDAFTYQFTIKANRFLRNMVRAVVGTLLEIGRGKLSMSQFIDIIEQKDRCAAGASVPGHALFLVDVEYPDTVFLLK